MEPKKKKRHHKSNHKFGILRIPKKTIIVDHSGAFDINENSKIQEQHPDSRKVWERTDYDED